MPSPFEAKAVQTVKLLTMHVCLGLTRMKERRQNASRGVIGFSDFEYNHGCLFL